MNRMMSESLIRCSKYFLFCISILSLNVEGAKALGKARSESTGSMLTVSHLKVATINVWSGLDYNGVFKFGEFETKQRRELRFALLLAQLRKLDPDVVFVQEANPVRCYSARLADSLGFDEVHQVCNAGIKFGGVGIPSNLAEGIAILARPALRLRNLPPWKLSGSFGLYGDAITINFDQTEFAEPALISVMGKEIYLVNVHLSAAPPLGWMFGELHEELSSGKLDSSQARTIEEDLSSITDRRSNEVHELLKQLSDLPDDVPVVLGGDFNSTDTSGEMRRILGSGEFTSARNSQADSSLPTWDAAKNEEISYSTDTAVTMEKDISWNDRASAKYDRVSRTIDYIFVKADTAHRCGISGVIAVDSSSGGVHASDHFGLLADVHITSILGDSLASEQGPHSNRASIEPLPIVSYDTDTHFGYGAKLFLFDLLKLNESFDMVAFNSTKGEKWYRLVFSIPDLESREGTVYPIALDFVFDYDKWLKNNFYGVGNQSRVSDGEVYTRIPVDIELDFSRGLSTTLVGQVILKHMSVENYNFSSASRLATLPPPLNSSTARYTTVGMTLRYDTRNSFINASDGVVLQGEGEFSPSWSLGNTSFTRAGGWFQYYSVLFYPTTIFAMRIGVQQVFGSNLPVQVMSSLGGTLNLRGYPQDRFLDRSDALLNAELRFPIFWRIGGVAGIDAGKVWSSLADFDIHNWAYNPLAGLRLYMDNYVVRVDVGFGKEATGFYFNFGQLF